MKKWYFTFGHGQEYYGCYVEVIAANYGEAREIMVSEHGDKWAFQYEEHQFEDAIQQWNYRLLERLMSEDVPIWWMHIESDSFVKKSYKELIDVDKNHLEPIGYWEIDTEKELRSIII